MDRGLQVGSGYGEQQQCNGTERKSCQCLLVDKTIPGAWTCDSGYFCPSASRGPFECPLGYYCPENSIEPTLCCAGYYCPSPSKIKKCTSGSFCKPGQIKPFVCGWTERCPEGTEDPKSLAMYIVFTASIMMLIIATLLKEKYYRWKTVSRQRRQENFQSGREENPHERPISEKNIEISQECSDTTETDTKDVEQQAVIRHNTLQGVKLEFENLGVNLPDGQSILSGVTGSLLPGHFTAIMGPSGAGKSTFINVLSNKVERSRGSIQVDGEPTEDGLAKYRSVFGFVPQEDVMLRHFTPYYNIMFSAEYRLPSSITKNERLAKVTKILDTLGLVEVQDSSIGDERERGISGGQRKRVNIGIEMVNDCSILFLDEPTSGLDASSAMDITKALRKSTEENGITTAAILHQPRTEIFELFTDLLLLGKGGKTIYNGTRAGAIPYFEKLGFRPPSHANPADFISDVSSGRVHRNGSSYFGPESETFFPAELLPNLWQLCKDGDMVDESKVKEEEQYYLTEIDKTKEAEIDRTSKWKLSQEIPYVLISLRSKIREELSLQKSNMYNSFCGKKRRKTAGVVSMFLICFTRAFKGMTHSFGKIFAENSLHFFVGFFLGIIASEHADVYVGPLAENMQQELCPVLLKEMCGKPQFDGIQEIGMFLAWGVSFAGAAVASTTFGPEESNYWREASAGLYTFPYFAAKVSVDVFKIALAAGVFELAYFAAATSALHISYFYVVIFLLYFNGFNIGYFLTNVVGVRLSPLISLVFTLLCSAVISGFAVWLPDVKSSWMWLFDMSYARWSMEHFYIISTEPFDYYDHNPALDAFGYTRNNRDLSLVYMLISGCIWSVVSCLCMCVRHLDKKR